MRIYKHFGELFKFSKGEYVPVAREEFLEGERLCLLWRGSPRVINVLHE